VTHFERLAADYDALRTGGADLIEALARENEPRGRLLDVGCGTGRFLAAFADVA
jgi:ubiquinone/menaquinone biosynthesis C-methylase UbiE